jgi:hypothetical protein
MLQCIDAKQFQSNNRTSNQLHKFVRVSRLFSCFIVINDFFKHFVGTFNTTYGINYLLWSLHTSTSSDQSFMCFGINATELNVACDKPSVAICAAVDGINKSYMGGVRKTFTNKGKILIDLINDLRIGVRQLLCEYYARNVRLPNKSVFFRIGPNDQLLKQLFHDEIRAITGMGESSHFSSRVESESF